VNRCLPDNEETSEKFYETVHETYFPLTQSTHSFLQSDRFTKCLDILEQIHPANLLEIGFEDPTLSTKIVGRLGTRYVGVDISESSVKEAIKLGLEAFSLDVSSQTLPFADSTFEMIYCSEVLEHLFNPDFAIEEFKRVLKPRGKILLSTPNLAAWYNRLLLLAGIQPVATEVSTLYILGRVTKFLGQGNRPVGHIRVFTYRALMDFLSLHKLRALELKGYALESLGKLVRIDKTLSRLPQFASGIIALTEKDG